jgi:hypothetical protein
MTMNKRAFVALWAACSVIALGQDASQNRGLLTRKYRDGEKLIYLMKGTDNGVRYEVQARGVVKRDAQGRFIEEYAWSNLVRNGVPVTLPASNGDFRQTLSLEPEHIPAIPNLSQVPRLIGPITDMLTFYADLWLTIREAKLSRIGDHFFQEANMASSWADGVYVILGESAIDFDITLTDIDKASQTATLLVRHIPPKSSHVKLPAPWMVERVADTANNWVSVRKNSDMYVAAVGKETFEVRMIIRLADGVILSGTLDNVVETRERDCKDAALLDCGETRPRRIRREIQISLER